MEGGATLKKVNKSIVFTFCRQDIIFNDGLEFDPSSLFRVVRTAEVGNLFLASAMYIHVTGYKRSREKNKVKMTKRFLCYTGKNNR